MLAIIFLTLFSFSVYSQSGLDIRVPKSACSDLDIKTNMSAELKTFFETPRDQDSIGWCFGFVEWDFLNDI